MSKAFQITLLSLSTLVIFAGLVLLLPSTRVDALSGSDFKAGNIIDDSVFYDSNTMSAIQIQAFLNAKVPTCDTNGTRIYSGSTTRAQYGASVGNPAPYTCLKDYSQAIPAVINSGSNLCTGNISAGAKSAAQIIYDVSQACGVSPQVLLVLLQKEQSLVTDDWPWERQYRSATGYGCPDTAPCDSEFYGFFNQVYQAAQGFKRYERNVTNYNYRAGRNNSILYNPNTACGSSVVYIHNQATAGLYIYTPYQPNAAALNNLYGSGDSCSAYGNRNFWRMFSDWFGTTTGQAYAASFSEYRLYSNQGLTVELPKVGTRYIASPGQTVYASVTVRNIGRVSWDNQTRLGTANPIDRSSPFRGTDWISTSRVVPAGALSPGATNTVQFSLRTPDAANVYTESFRVVVDGKAWTSSQLDLAFNITPPTSPPAGYSNHILGSGQSINAAERIISTDGYSTLGIESGRVTLRTNFVSSWTAGSNSSRLVMQSDGNLVVYNSSNQPTWDSGTVGNGPSRLVMQSDGNLVVYTESGQPTWSSGTILPVDHHSYPHSSISSNGTMYTGQNSQNISRKHALILQSDGNLVLYSGGRATWATYTVNSGAVRLVMQSDGNLVLYNKDNRAVWNSGTVGHGASSLQIQSDGNLVVYNSTNSATWASNTAGR